MYHFTKWITILNIFWQLLQIETAHGKNLLINTGFLTAKWATDETSKRKPKWLPDEAGIAELYGRIGLLNLKN